VPETAAALFKPKRLARKNASGDPIKKLGNTPINVPIAKPMAVRDGEALSRKTARHFNAIQRQARWTRPGPGCPILSWAVLVGIAVCTVRFSLRRPRLGGLACVARPNGAGGIVFRRPGDPSRFGCHENPAGRYENPATALRKSYRKEEWIEIWGIS